MHHIHYILLTGLLAVNCLPEKKHSNSEVFANEPTSQTGFSTQCVVQDGISLSLREAGDQNSNRLAVVEANTAVMCEKPEAIGYVQCQYSGQTGYLYYRSDWIACDGVQISNPNPPITTASSITPESGVSLAGYHFDYTDNIISSNDAFGRQGWAVLFSEKGAGKAGEAEALINAGYKVIVRYDFRSHFTIPPVGTLSLDNAETREWIVGMMTLYNKGVRHIQIGNEMNVWGTWLDESTGLFDFYSECAEAPPGYPHRASIEEQKQWVMNNKNIPSQPGTACSPSHYKDVINFALANTPRDLHLLIAAVSPDSKETSRSSYLASSERPSIRWTAGDAWLRAFHNQFGCHPRVGLSLHAYGRKSEFTDQANIQLNAYPCGSAYVTEFNTLGAHDGRNHGAGHLASLLADIYSHADAYMQRVKAISWYSWKGSFNAVEAYNNQEVRDAVRAVSHYSN